MKEIIYGGEPKIVDRGVYNGLKYIIINLGSHPAAYVENIIGIRDYLDDRLSNIDVHGGLIYCESAYWDSTDKTSYLGWDYGHIGDCIVFSDLLYNGKKWTYEEILSEVKSVIDQLIELNKGVR